MADTGWICAASGRNIDLGLTNWTYPANVTGAGDNAYSAMSLNSGTAGDELNAYNFTMNVPAGKQIDGIYCCIRKKDPEVSMRDHRVYLMEGTAHKGENKADTGTSWPINNTWIYYGGAADLWNAAWTAAQINASTFGLIVEAKNHHGSSIRSAMVDSMSIKVYYSDAAPSVSDHLMMMGM